MAALKRVGLGIFFMFVAGWVTIGVAAAFISAYVTMEYIFTVSANIISLDLSFHDASRIYFSSIKDRDPLREYLFGAFFFPGQIFGVMGLYKSTLLSLNPFRKDSW